MMATDTLNYLPKDILTKVDRAAMAVSLETRAPLLGQRVAAVAWHLPMPKKIRCNTSKWALRQILSQHVPRQLIERLIAGFGIPIGQWLRGPLREWARDLLEPGLVQRKGYLRPDTI
jgi:asparagine synthase (glutamine-hydrolysing)